MQPIPLSRNRPRWRREGHRFARDCPLYSVLELHDLLFPHAGESGSVLDEGRRERLLFSERFYLSQALSSGESIDATPIAMGDETRLALLRRLPGGRSGVDFRARRRLSLRRWFS